VSGSKCSGWVVYKVDRGSWLTFSAGTTGMPHHFYCSICDRMLRGDHAGGRQKSAQEHYRSEHPRETFKLHVVFTYWEHPRSEDCSCQSLRFCTCSAPICTDTSHYNEDSDSHLLNATIFINGAELRMLPVIGASSVDDITDSISTEDGTDGHSIDFLIGETLYRLEYYVANNGTLKEVCVYPYRYQGHADHPPIVDSRPVSLSLVIETRYAGEPTHRYYSETGGTWTLPPPQI
jgi:hypothetical protein